MQKPTRKPERNYSSPRNFVYVLRKLVSWQDDDTRREHARYPKRLSLKIQPLNGDYMPDGEPFWAISSDVSKRGMGFIMGDPIDHEHLRITVEEDVSVIATVRHCTSIGNNYPLYLVGVEFLDEYLV